MTYWIQKNKNSLIIIGAVSILIPLLYVSYKVFTAEGNSASISLEFNPILGYALIAYYILLIGLIIGYFIHWLISNIKLIINLKKEKAKTELMHLQSQVNPHFFFNMLNNLYGLVGTDSEKAQALILKLSDMMRYSIYEGENEFVTLNEEADYLINYIELHKIRYHKKIDVTFESNIQENYKVKPLLFIILLENAFKHGVENLIDNAYIHAKISTEENDIYFEIENNFDSEIKGTSGIGIENLKRRLELVYPNKHKLSFSISNNVYHAQLTLKQL
jgi:LytS/YehU family sensor histidine kinase